MVILPITIPIHKQDTHNRERQLKSPIAQQSGDKNTSYPSNHSMLMGRTSRRNAGGPGVSARLSRHQHIFLMAISCLLLLESLFLIMSFFYVTDTSNSVHRDNHTFELEFDYTNADPHRPIPETLIRGLKRELAVGDTKLGEAKQDDNVVPPNSHTNTNSNIITYSTTKPLRAINKKNISTAKVMNLKFVNERKDNETNHPHAGALDENDKPGYIGTSMGTLNTLQGEKVRSLLNLSSQQRLLRQFEEPGGLQEWIDNELELGWNSTPAEWLKDLCPEVVEHFTRFPLAKSNDPKSGVGGLPFMSTEHAAQSVSYSCA
jgi:hypothetical protein